MGPESNPNHQPTYSLSNKGPHKSLKNYAYHFNQESLIINNCNEGVATVAFMEGISFPYYLMTLVRVSPKTMTELLDEVKKQIRVEETSLVSQLSCPPPSVMGIETHIITKRGGRGGGGKKDKKNKDKTNTFEDKPKLQFNPLTVPLREIFTQIRPDQLPKPNKIKTSDKKKDTSKYCMYHKDHGHDTNNCWKLKKEIEKLISQG